MNKVNTVQCRRPQPGATSAFTHVELLVVLVCLSILATILVPAIHASKQQRGRLGLLSALRAYGTGIDMYVDDHDGYLPGPVNGGQGARYNRTTKKSLCYYIWNYLGGDEPVKVDSTISALVDVYREELGFPTIYFRQGRATVNGVPDVDPFGYPGGFSYPEPMPIHVIDNPSSTWALRDTSKEDQPGNPGWAASLPPKAIYGAPYGLFFDGHVESLPGGEPLY